MKKILFFGIISIILSCQQEKQAVAEPVLNEGNMTAILVDLHLIEAHITQLKLNASASKDSLFYFKQLLFKKNRISETDFKMSLNYYSHYPDQIKEIYTEVKTILRSMDLKLPEIKENNQHQNSNKKSNVSHGIPGNKKQNFPNLNLQKNKKQ